MKEITLEDISDEEFNAICKIEDVEILDLDHHVNGWDFIACCATEEAYQAVLSTDSHFFVTESLLC
jgi:hypothetical protein